jgi:hypothetical protein
VEAPDGGFFDLPDGRATYELTNEITRALDWSKLSTKMSSKWKFTMDPAVSGDPLALNLQVAAPGADLRNRLNGHKPNQLILTPEPTQPGTAISAARLSISYDDGTTWRALPTRRQGDHFTALLPPAPSRATYLTLRAGTTDAAGNDVQHTITRAYSLR